MTAVEQAARQRAILAHYAAGTRLKIIAAMFDVCISYPTHLAKKRGLPLRRRFRIR